MPWYHGTEFNCVCETSELIPAYYEEIRYAYKCPKCHEEFHYFEDRYFDDEYEVIEEPYIGDAKSRELWESHYHD